MIRLSTKGRYGLLLMLELAEKYGKGTTTLREISRSYDISEKYLWHLVRMLRNAGLVHSTQGPHGGYGLARPTDKINLSEILSVLEGPLDLVESASGSVGSVGRPDGTLDNILIEVSKKVSDIFLSYTLKDMLAMRQTRHVSDYSI